MIPVLLALAVVLFIGWRFLSRSPLSHLPGPPTIPLLGNALGMPPDKLNFVLADWKHKYGPVYRIRILNEDILVIAGIDAAIESLVKKGEDFAGRAPMWRFDYLVQGDIINGDYLPRLQFMRKIALKLLHQHAEGLNHLENVVQSEVEEMVQVIDNHAGKDFDPSEDISGAVTNIMATLLLGDRFGYGSPAVRKMKKNSDLFEEGFDIGGGAILDVMPWLRHLPIPIVQHWMKSLRTFKESWTEFDDTYIVARKNQLDDSRPRGIVDELKILQKELGKDQIPDEMFKPFVFDLLGAGTQTTSFTLYSMCFLLAHHPDIQQRMSEEVERVVGASRLPSTKDRHDMPYIQAVIKETLRLASTAHVTFFHRTTKDTSVASFKIPKDTKVLVSIWAIHHDPAHWLQPETFNPDNFLTADGQLRPPDSGVSYLPFGAGKRNCAGEALAKNRLFLMASAIVQRFKILPPSDPADLPACDVHSFVSKSLTKPQPYKVRFVPRS